MPAASSRKSTHDSYWIDGQLEATCPPLSGGGRTQVAIVGGGITGLTAGYLLRRHGLEVAIIESLAVGGGTTGGSTGHLDALPEEGLTAFCKRFGEDVAKKYIAARLAAIDAIEARSDAATDFTRVDAVQYTENEGSLDTLRQDCETARRLGLDATWEPAIAIAGGVGGYRVRGLGRMNSYAYLRHLKALFLQEGGKIYEGTTAGSSSESRVTELPTSGGPLKCEHVIMATHSNYSAALRIYFQTPPYQSYVVAVEVDEELPDALYWDDADPYHYTRRARSGDSHLLIVGGEDHRTGLGDPEESFRRLEQYAASKFRVRQYRGRWSAEFFESSDGLPLIGLVPGQDNVYVATGMSGVGLTLGTVAGEMLANRVRRIDNPLDEAFDPSRFGLKGVGSMVAEQAQSARNVAERVLPSHSVDVDALQPGQGDVGKVDGQFSAVCRDRSGQLHRFNPVCVHMGGVVHWNEAEQTWDCPVHGGRYCADGSRLYGPPQSGLVPPGETAKEE